MKKTKISSELAIWLHQSFGNKDTIEWKSFLFPEGKFSYCENNVDLGYSFCIEDFDIQETTGYPSLNGIFKFCPSKFEQEQNINGNIFAEDNFWFIQFFCQNPSRNEYSEWYKILKLTYVMLSGV